MRLLLDTALALVFPAFICSASGQNTTGTETPRRADDGKAVLMVSSYLRELFGLCDRLAVMRRGQLSEARPVSDWTPESVLAAAMNGR